MALRHHDFCTGSVTMKRTLTLSNYMSFEKENRCVCDEGGACTYGKDIGVYYVRLTVSSLLFSDVHRSAPRVTCRYVNAVV